MRRDEYEELSNEAAKAELLDEDYDLIISKIKSRGKITMEYVPIVTTKATKNEDGTLTFQEVENTTGEIINYENLIPIGFYLSDYAHLWAYHEVHGRKESFACRRIISVNEQ